MGSEYPEDWDAIRGLVYQRDDYTCQNCGAVGGAKGNTELHAHHIKSRSEGGSDKPRNLTTLCQECHSQVHGRQVGSAESQTSYNSKNSTEGVGWGIRIAISTLSFILAPVLQFIAGLLGYSHNLVFSWVLAMFIVTPFFLPFADV